jgi:peptidyl-prolyl cis-trans isomerase B (cyclophilin B)
MLKKYSVYLLIFFLFAFISKSFSQFTGIYTGKPIYDILVKRSGIYLGTVTVELFPNIAPLHVRNFDSLVSEQFFDSTAFHRVIPGFMIQGGDPNSRHGDISTWGSGDPSQPTVNAEFSAARHLRGILSAARDADINSANSQFFICVATAAWLNGQYSVYGKTTAGINIVDTIVNSPRDANDNPLQKIEMFITRTGSNDTIPNAPNLYIPVSGTTGVGTSKQLRWNVVSDAIYYHLEVSTDSLFITLFKSLDVATIVNTASGLAAGTTYYWRVKTNNGGHWSPYSPVWNFSTAGGLGIQSPYENSTRVIVSPNPSEGKFIFSNLENNAVIEIYDVTGKIIYKIISKQDMQSVDLDEKDKGIYFYKIIQSGKNEQLGKLIIQ